MRTSTRNANRLSILYFLAITAGVGIAISISRGIERVRFPADSFYNCLDSIGGMDASRMLVAAIYGVCVTTFLFAWRSGNLWNSPGKTLALLFAAMCVIEWSLELFAAVVVSDRMQTQLAAGVPDTRGIIAGRWYRNFAPSIGYVAGLPILAVVVYKTRQQRFSWRAVWVGFLIFTLLINGLLHFSFGGFVSPSVHRWYFELAMGIPMVLLVIALLESLARREPVDWWTTIIAPMIIVTWGLEIALKTIAS